MTRSTEPYKTINLFDWTGGIKDRRKNPLAFPMNALMAGENVELVDGGLSVRGGMSVVSAGSLPIGEVRMLRHVRFPTNETSYLVAQVSNAGWTEYAGPGLIGNSETYSGILEHTAIYCPYTGAILVFGGFRDLEGYWVATNDLWSVDPSTGTWTLLEPEGDVPSARGSHVAIWDDANSRMIVHGGVAEWAGGGLGGMPDVWQYDPETNVWTELETLNGPYGRSKHCAVYDSESGRMLINGGTSETELKPFGVFCALDLATLEWSVIDNEPEDPAPEGSIYNGYAGWHHSAVLHDGTVYTLGGQIDEVCSNAVMICPVSSAASWGELLPGESGCHWARSRPA
jgi:hypothetical protein